MVISITPTVFVPTSSSAFYGFKRAEIQVSGIKLKKVPMNVKLRTASISEVSEAAHPTQVVATWQIIAGSLAGVTPFVVAGIEFSKRIVAQRNCKVCKGSGLVLRDQKYYFRCPKCGGFLPWQSWKRFFSG